MLRGTTRIESGSLQKPKLHSWHVTNVRRTFLLITTGFALNYPICQSRRSQRQPFKYLNRYCQYFRMPAPECSLIAWPNVTALSVGDAVFLSKFLGQESPSQPFSCFAALNWYYINIIKIWLQYLFFTNAQDFIFKSCILFQKLVLTNLSQGI